LFASFFGVYAQNMLKKLPATELKDLDFSRLSRKAFVDAWESGQLTSLWIGQQHAVVREGKNEVIRFLTETANAVNAELKNLATDLPRKRTFMREKRMSESDFKKQLRLSDNPALFAYTMMANINASRHGRPIAHFGMGRDKTRYFVAPK